MDHNNSYVTIYGNMVIVKHINYFKKSTKHTKLLLTALNSQKKQQLRREVVSPDGYRYFSCIPSNWWSSSAPLQLHYSTAIIITYVVHKTDKKVTLRMRNDVYLWLSLGIGIQLIISLRMRNDVYVTYARNVTMVFIYDLFSVEIYNY